MRRLLVLAALLFGLPAHALDIEWVVVGDPGNAPDTAANCFAEFCGYVAEEYRISKYEITNAQYVEFLNAKARFDPLGLYNPNMAGDAFGIGGITRSGSSGLYDYAVKPGFANQPVVYVSFYDAIRFANWVNNGQGNANTEQGAYGLVGGTPTPSNGTTVTRNPAASVFLPSENEWYKAAYYSPEGTWFDYPTGTDSPTSCVAPAADSGNSANCSQAVGFTLTDVGAYSLSDGPYGTFDQGGNAWEWNEEIEGTNRGLRGGAWNLGGLSAPERSLQAPGEENNATGFRVASVPEPGASLLGSTALLALAARRVATRQRASASATNCSA